MATGLCTQTDEYNTSVSIQFCSNDVNPLIQNCTYVDIIHLLWSWNSGLSRPY